MSICSKRFTFHRFEVCESTNDEALRCTQDMSVFVARVQKKGRGRRGHQWISQTGNLFSTVLYLTKDLNNIGCYSLAAAISIGEALRVLSPSLDISYKWPNDVLISDKKVCGILLETSDNPLRVAIGLGVNVTDYPQDLSDYGATSLHAQGILDVSAEDILQTYLCFLDYYMQIVKSGETDKVINEWLMKCSHLNKPIKVMLAEEVIFGIFKGLDSSGNLILSVLDGVHRKDLLISAGEVLF